MCDGRRGTKDEILNEKGFKYGDAIRSTRQSSKQIVFVRIKLKRKQIVKIQLFPYQFHLFFVKLVQTATSFVLFAFNLQYFQVFDSRIVKKTASSCFLLTSTRKKDFRKVIPLCFQRNFMWNRQAPLVVGCHETAKIKFRDVWNKILGAEMKFNCRRVLFTILGCHFTCYRFIFLPRKKNWVSHFDRDSFWIHFFSFNSFFFHEIERSAQVWGQFRLK